MTIEARLKSIQARDLMTKFAITAREDQTIVDLANLFMRFKISGVPVVNGSDQIVGMVTASNLFDHMKSLIDEIDAGKDFQYDCSIPVKKIMIPDVVTISEETSLYEMIKLMCDKHIHTFPIVKEGKMTGVVGRRDVMNACYAAVCYSQG